MSTRPLDSLFTALNGSMRAPLASCRLNGTGWLANTTTIRPRRSCTTRSAARTLMTTAIATTPRNGSPNWSRCVPLRNADRSNAAAFVSDGVGILDLVDLPHDSVSRELDEQEPVRGQALPRVGPDFALHARKLINAVRRTEQLPHVVRARNAGFETLEIVFSEPLLEHLQLAIRTEARGENHAPERQA